MGCFNVTTNNRGIPYLSSTNTTVGTESVDIALGFIRECQVLPARTSCNGAIRFCHHRHQFRKKSRPKRQGDDRRGLPLCRVRLTDAIQTGTTATLPVTLTLNGTTRALTLFDGTPVTVAELIGGTGVFTVFNDRFNGILQLVSRTTV